MYINWYDYKPRLFDYIPPHLKSGRRGPDLQLLSQMQELAQQAAAGMPGRRVPAGGMADRGMQTRTSLLYALGEQLGEPTSYGGQGPLTQEEITQARDKGLVMGATGEPVQIIRGMRGSYSGPRGGPEEYLTLGQARQALRRELGTGEYVPPGYTLEQIKAARKKPAEGGTVDPVKYFETYLTHLYGEPTKEGEKVLPPFAQEFLLQNLPRATSPDAVQQLIKENEGLLKKYHEMHSLGKKENRLLAYQNYLTAKKLGLAPDVPNAMDIFEKAPITEETYNFFRQWRDWKAPSAPPAPQSRLEPEPQPAQPAPKRMSLKENLGGAYIPLISAANPLWWTGQGASILARGLWRDLTTPQYETFDSPFMKKPQLRPQQSLRSLRGNALLARPEEEEDLLQ